MVFHWRALRKRCAAALAFKGKVGGRGALGRLGSFSTRSLPDVRWQRRAGHVCARALVRFVRPKLVAEVSVGKWQPAAEHDTVVPVARESCSAAAHC
jgi:hypothetical protein